VKEAERNAKQEGVKLKLESRGSNPFLTEKKKCLQSDSFDLLREKFAHHSSNSSLDHHHHWDDGNDGKCKE